MQTDLYLSQRKQTISKHPFGKLMRLMKTQIIAMIEQNGNGINHGNYITHFGQSNKFIYRRRLLNYKKKNGNY
jgi:hypothetical protein